MAMSEGKDLKLVRRYRQVVENYEAVDGQIDALIMANKGKSEDMSAADRHQYRSLARRRSEFLNEMRILEQQLNLVEDDAPGAE